jgi:hypothetical protein
MQSAFYVSQKGQQVGPLSVEQILDKVAKGELDATDYCYDEVKEDWVLLGEHPQMSGGVKKASGELTQVKDEPVTTESVPHGDKEWFVLKGESKFGPFPFHELIKMLQEKSIFEFDYVWHSGLSTWERIAEVPEFRPHNIKRLRDSGQAKISDIFFRRRHMRVEWASSIVIHDNKHLWRGESLEISAGGAGVVIHNASLNPGQTLYLHFKPADGVPAFNAVCEIVSKQYVKNVKSKDAPVRYGVKFTKINTTTQKALQEYADKKSQTAA